MMLKFSFVTLIAVAVSALAAVSATTYDEVADKGCKVLHSRYWKNSADGIKAQCDKSADCLGYELNKKKTQGRGCLKSLNSGGLKKSDGTGMKDKTGYTLYIKETCDDGLKNQDETDIDCGGAICEACKHKNSCAPQPTCTDNKPAPDCVGGVCKCGSSDSCLVSKKETAPLCVSGTCKCAAAVAECTTTKKCIEGTCQEPCGDMVACPSTEVCDSSVCKCADKNGIKGPTCVGHPGGEICDATASAPTCKCTSSVDSCAGNLLKPNCNAADGKCECAPGDDGCTAPHKCVGKECKCGTAAACTDPLAPTCDAGNSKCMCGTSPGCDNFKTADTCDKENNKCLCGTADPCTKPQVCKEKKCVDP